MIPGRVGSGPARAGTRDKNEGSDGEVVMVARERRFQHLGSHTSSFEGMVPSVTRPPGIDQRLDVGLGVQRPSAH